MTMTNKAIALIGKTITTTDGKLTAEVLEWSKQHPLESGEGSGLFPPVECGQAQDGWLKLKLHRNGTGQWWRYDLVMNTFNLTH